MKIFSRVLILSFLFPFIFGRRRTKEKQEDEFSYKCSLFGTVPNMAVILPRKDIYREIGHPTSVYCRINPMFNLTADKIYFTKGLENEKIIESTIVDNYTIKTNIIEMQPINYILICRTVDQIMCGRETSIGYPPLNVLDFHCVSFNWQVLTCAYNLPVNPAQRKKDDYLVSYSSEEYESEQIGYKCPELANKTCCPLKGEECWIWGTSAYYPYERFSQFIYVKIFSKNSIGKKSFIYEINQFEIMIPQNVRELRALPFSARKIKIEFELPVFLSLFPPGITYKVRASCQWNDYYLVGTLRNVSRAELTMDVLWPGQQYKIDVLLRSGNKSWSKVEENDGWWSKSYLQDVTVTTPSISPWTAPDVTPGIFQIVPNNGKSKIRNIIVAWRRMAEFLHGGINFTYKLETFVGGEKIITSYQVTETFAIFENLSWKESYRFVITPENEVGIGNSSAVVVVDIKEIGWKDPLFFPIVIHYKGDQIVELRWFTEEKIFQNFTLFWCDDGSLDLRSPCMRNLNWIYVGNVRAVNLTYEDLSMDNSLTQLRFALTASSRYQEGMSWASCGLMDDSETYSIIVSAPIIVQKNSSLAVVTWNLDCSHWRKLPTESEIIWCKGRIQNIPDCFDLGILKVPVWPQESIIEGLDPNSAYTVWIRVFYKRNSIDVSFPAFFTTEADVLSPIKIVLFVAISLLMTIAIILGLTYGIRKIVEIYDDYTRAINTPKGLLPKGMSPHDNHIKRTPFLEFLFKFIIREKDATVDNYRASNIDGGSPLVSLRIESTSPFEESIPLKSFVETTSFVYEENSIEVSSSNAEFSQPSTTKLKEEVTYEKTKKQEYISLMKSSNKISEKADKESPSLGYIQAIEFMKVTIPSTTIELESSILIKTDLPPSIMDLPFCELPKETIYENQQPLIVQSGSLFCNKESGLLPIDNGETLQMPDPKFNERSNLIAYNNNFLPGSEDYSKLSSGSVSSGYVQAHECK